MAASTKEQGALTQLYVATSPEIEENDFSAFFCLFCFRSASVCPARVNVYADMGWLRLVGSLKF